MFPYNGRVSSRQYRRVESQKALQKMLHGEKMTIEISVASHIGKYRKKQEDAFLVEYDPVKDEHLLVVADGMGGHEHGKWGGGYLCRNF